MKYYVLIHTSDFGLGCVTLFVIVFMLLTFAVNSRPTERRSTSRPTTSSEGLSGKEKVNKVLSSPMCSGGGVYAEGLGGGKRLYVGVLE